VPQRTCLLSARQRRPWPRAPCLSVCVCPGCGECRGEMGQQFYFEFEARESLLAGGSLLKGNKSRVRVDAKIKGTCAACKEKGRFGRGAPSLASIKVDDLESRRRLGSVCWEQAARQRQAHGPILLSFNTHTAWAGKLPRS
jgi:hypothetical protein